MICLIQKPIAAKFKCVLKNKIATWMKLKINRRFMKSKKSYGIIKVDYMTGN